MYAVCILIGSYRLLLIFTLVSKHWEVNIGKPYGSFETFTLQTVISEVTVCNINVWFGCQTKVLRNLYDRRDVFSLKQVTRRVDDTMWEVYKNV